MAIKIPGVEKSRPNQEIHRVKTYSVLYHDVFQGSDVERSGFPGSDAGAYKLNTDAFANHLRAIASATRVKPGRAPDLAGMNAASSWLIHFDDGGNSAWQLIAPMLREFGWHGHFYITTDYIDKPGFVSREELRLLRRDGHVIGSHSCSHPPRISELNSSDLLDQWKRSRETLSNILGEEVTVASVPGGFYTMGVAEAASDAGIKILFTSEPVSTGLGLVKNCQVFGRYSVMARTPPATAAAIASGQVAPRLTQYVYWNVKKLAKAAAGRTYARIRQRYFDRK